MKVKMLDLDFTINLDKDDEVIVKHQDYSHWYQWNIKGGSNKIYAEYISDYERKARGRNAGSQ